MWIGAVTPEAQNTTCFSQLLLQLCNTVATSGDKGATVLNSLKVAVKSSRTRSTSSVSYSQFLICCFSLWKQGKYFTAVFLFICQPSWLQEVQYACPYKLSNLQTLELHPSITHWPYGSWVACCSTIRECNITSGQIQGKIHLCSRRESNKSVCVWLTWAGLSLWKIVQKWVELQTTQQWQAGATLFTASKRWERRGRGKCRHQDVAEQGQSTCHIALGQVHAHQAEESVGLREESKTEQEKIVREDRRKSSEI